MKTLLRLFAVGTILALSQSTASAALLKEKKVGNWSAGAYSYDESGKFSHCAASARYRNGVALLFTINAKYQWSVGLVSEAWKLEKGSRYPVSLRVDDGRLLEEQAVAVLPNFVKVQLADSRVLFDAFKYGRLLKIYAAGQTFQFQLTDTSVLLPELLACVKNYEEQPPQSASNPFQPAQPTQTESNPFSSPAPAPRPADTPVPTGTTDLSDRRAEATSLVANILGRAGVNNFEILSPEQSKGFTSDAAWRAPGAFGSVSIVSSTTTNPEDITASLLSSDSRSCHDRFLSGTKPDNSGTRVFTSCVSDKQTLTIYYSTIKRPRGGYYVLATGSFESGQSRGSGGAGGSPAGKPTHEVDSGIRTAAFTILAH